MKELNVYIKESKNSPDENYHNVKELGEGEFNGILWGHCFLYEGNKYYSEIGWKNMFPSYCNMKINESEAWPCQVDKYQRQDLKKLFD